MVPSYRKKSTQEMMCGILRKIEEYQLLDKTSKVTGEEPALPKVPSNPPISTREISNDNIRKTKACRLAADAAFKIARKVKLC